MKQSEGWDIKLKRKVKDSIGAKTFLSMLSLLIICCVIIYGMVMIFLPKNYQWELESQFVAEFERLVNNLGRGDVDSNSQEIISFSVRNNAVVIIYDSSGEEIYSINVNNIEDNISGKVLSMLSQYNFENQLFTIRAEASFVAVSQTYKILIKLLPFILITIFVISIIGAYICSRSFSKPLIEICGVAKRMGSLDMTWKCDTSRSDEIGSLANSLNDMSKRLDAALNNLRDANEQLQQDIKKEKKQEQQRIDFFTSVSHELKTPITVIKGELEGMIYQVGDYKDRDTYLRHSLKTVGDMEKLVKEILEAAKMGGSDFHLNKTELNISDMIKKCCREVQGLAEDKSICFNVSLQPDYRYIGDEGLLYRAFRNIIGNAVFYSPEGERVTALLENDCFIVENTGVHISPEDLEQVFIPFFRADKSRNRNTGGSGLGLYITKIILDHHCIDYNMENTSEGVKFTIGFQNYITNTP